MEELLWTVQRLAWELPRDLLTRQAHQFRRMWNAVRGNARALAAYNIFWTLPMNFMNIYLPVFMKERGLTEIEIGSIVSAQLATQAVGALLGGWLAERFGRLRTITWVDTLCWPAAYLCFAFADGYLAFLAGAILVGGIFFLVPSWNALYVGGSPANRRMHLFGILQIPWFVGSLIASSSTFLVGRVGVTTACRWVFGGAALLTAFGVWYRGKHLTHADPPPKPLRLTLAEVQRIGYGHWLAFKAIATRRQMSIVFLMMILLQAAMVTAGTYNNLYLSDERGVGLPKPTLALLPLFSGTVVLLMTFAVVPFITARGVFKFLFVGLGAMWVGSTLFLIAPSASLPTVIAGVLCGATGFSMLNPSLFGYWANQMSDRERPRIHAFLWVVSMAVTMPVPTLAGALYKVNPRGPLLMVLGCYAGFLALGVLAAVRARRGGTTAS